MAKKRKKTLRKTALKAADLKKFEELLLRKRAEILGDVNHMKEETLKKERSDLSNVPFHMADAGSDNFELENTLGLMDEEVRLLAEIDAALSRIERKTYGVCEGSGEPIPKSRLEAIPWARYCVEYKELLEKGLIEAPGSDEGYMEDSDKQESDREEDRQTEEEQSKEDELDEVMEQLDEQISMMGDDEGDEEEDRDKS
jgi:DnaK suppressor protein